MINFNEMLIVERTVILARHNEVPEDDILNVETCSSMLFVIVVFYIIVQSLVKTVNNKQCTVLVSNYELLYLSPVHTKY